MDAATFKQAATLRAIHGTAGGLAYAAAQAIECGRTGDQPGQVRWRAIIDELRFQARPPQTSQLDIYRAAHILLGTYGEAEALRVLEDRARCVGPMHAGVYSLLRAAVVDLARRELGWQELIQ